MNFLKKILGIDSTSSKREVLFAEKTETAESVISADDILTYKKEGDVVYAYLNQTALDAFLYNRAKIRSKELQSYYNGERAITLHDISINDHSVHLFPIIDGEYAEKGDLVLAVGLKSLHFSNYCNDNRIFDTLSYSSVNLYSEYSGFFTKNVKDTMIDFCNLNNIIKDGDLLFTIKLGTKPKEIDTSTIEVRFSHNLLSRDFLDSVPNLSDITFKGWLVEDQTMVNKGDDIIEVTEFTSFSSPKFSTTIKAPKKGVLIKKYRSLIEKKLFIGTSLFTILGEDNS